MLTTVWGESGGNEEKHRRKSHVESSALQPYRVACVVHRPSRGENLFCILPGSALLVRGALVDLHLRRKAPTTEK